MQVGHIHDPALNMALQEKGEPSCSSVVLRGLGLGRFCKLDMHSMFECVLDPRSVKPQVLSRMDFAEGALAGGGGGGGICHHSCCGQAVCHQIAGSPIRIARMCSYVCIPSPLGAVGGLVHRPHCVAQFWKYGGIDQWIRCRQAGDSLLLHVCVSQCAAKAG